MRKLLRRFIDKNSRLKQYFLRGHTVWFALAFSLINFTLIFYKLFLENLEFFPEELKSYGIFFIVFNLIYFPVATVLGYYDLKKGTFNAEQMLYKEINPVFQELFGLLIKTKQSLEKIEMKLEIKE